MTNMFGNFDQDSLIKLMALQQGFATENEDDGDDSYAEEDDDALWAEEDDDAAPRGRTARGYRQVQSRSLRKMKGSNATTIKAPNGQQMQVRFGETFAKAADVNKLIADTEAKFQAALKERKENHAALTKQISDVNGSVSKLGGRVKKLEGNAQTSTLLSLMTAPPKIETMTFETDPKEGGTVKVKDVKYAAQDMMLPLLLSGALGGGDGTDNTALLMFALMAKK